MKRLSLAVALLSVLAAGCRAEVGLVLDVNQDGSGTLSAEVGINDQLRELITQLFGADSEGVISELDLGIEGESETRLERDMTIYTTEATFSEVEAIPEAAAGNFTSFQLDLADEGVSLEATLDVAGELDLSQFPVDPNAIDADTLQAQIVVSLPGDPSEHNADRLLDDGSYAWDIPFDSELYMFATTLYPTSGFPWWLPGLLALSGGLALVVWLAAVRRDRKGATERRPAPKPPTPPQAPQGQPRASEESPFFDFE